MYLPAEYAIICLSFIKYYPLGKSAATAGAKKIPRDYTIQTEEIHGNC